jgi:hypothetical protein
MHKSGYEASQLNASGGSAMISGSGRGCSRSGTVSSGAGALGRDREVRVGPLVAPSLRGNRDR